MTGSARGYRDGPHEDPQEASAALDPLLGSLSRRWRMQIHMITAGAWMRAVATGSMGLTRAESMIPSALEPIVPGTNTDGHHERNRRSVTTCRHLLITDGLAAGAPARGSPGDNWQELLSSTDPRSGRDRARIHLLLPRPGDARGLTGKSLELGCDHGAALIVSAHGRDRVLVAIDEHEGLVTWTSEPTGDDADLGFSIQPDHVHEADRHLREAIVHAESVLSDLGHRGLGARSRDLLDRHLRTLQDSPLPASSEAVRIPQLARSIAMTWTCDLALADESPAITSSDVADRRRIVLDLDRAARRAVEASLT